MLKSTVVAYFGNQSEAARALKITRISVSEWPDPPEPIPEICALRLHIRTRGQLRYNEKLYDRRKRRGQTEVKAATPRRRKRRA